VAAYFLSFFLMRGSIMTEKIERRGVRAPDAYEPDVLQGGKVKRVMTPVVPSTAAKLPYVYLTDDIGLAAEMMGQYNTDTLLVRDSEDSAKNIGIVTSAAILAYYSQQKQKEDIYHSPGRTRRMMVTGRRLFLEPLTAFRLKDRE
jgi:hypothetical protein